MKYMFDYLDHMRSQPESKRKRNALLVSILITSIVIVFWVPTLKVQLAQSNTSTDSTPNIDSPMVAVTQNVSTGVNSIKNLYSQVQGDIQNLSVTAGTQSYSNSQNQSPDQSQTTNGVQPQNIQQPIDSTTGLPVNQTNGTQYQTSNQVIDPNTGLDVNPQVNQQNTQNNTLDTSVGAYSNSYTNNTTDSGGQPQQ